MNRKWFSILALIAAATFFVNLSSCGFNKHLVSISIAPTGATFGALDTSLFVNFTATGTYEHPPETKDVTNIVTWTSDTPQVASVTSGGVVSPSLGCGTANVYATFYDSPNQVTSNSAFITVDGPANQGCPQSNALATLSVIIGGGTGTVTSSPQGINCGAVCSAQFTTGSEITLTGTPTPPSTSVTWSGCSPNGSICTVILETTTAVTATFQ